MLEKRKRKSASEPIDDETLNRARRRKTNANEEDKLASTPNDAPAVDEAELLTENFFMAYMERYMNDNLYENEPRRERFFFPDEDATTEEDDFDDDFDEDFEELSDDEFAELIDGPAGSEIGGAGLEETDESCKNIAESEDEEWDSLDAEENVFEED